MRMSGRPAAVDHVGMVFDPGTAHGQMPVAGDEPGGVLGGVASLFGRPVVVLRSRHRRAAGPAPRIASSHLTGLAVRLGHPIVLLIDAPGCPPVPAPQREPVDWGTAGPGGPPVPVVTVLTGECDGTAAAALDVADRALMMENATYTVPGPDSAVPASAAARTPLASLHITAAELLAMGVLDAVVPEPDGGAHCSARQAADLLRRGLMEALTELAGASPTTLVAARRNRFRRYGAAEAMMRRHTPERHAAPRVPTGAGAR
ncbi:hypothetical protein AB0J21_15480 [Streptomyces sp. NPDC049954]|uniref:hypothetical protein n=1 Tax=Streptomyces sp. NPDC049954 TaxID=3155779 RepID=UPI0034342C29